MLVPNVAYQKDYQPAPNVAYQKDYQPENPMRPWLDQYKANKAKLLRGGNDPAHGSALALLNKA